MQKITINPSIAVTVDIASVGHHEVENIYFKADSNWLGAYDAKIWNSFQKNTQHVVLNNITVAADVITFTIAPSMQGLPPKAYYYEIWHTSSQRVIFKGLLDITP